MFFFIYAWAPKMVAGTKRHTRLFKDRNAKLLNILEPFLCWDIHVTEVKRIDLIPFFDQASASADTAKAVSVPNLSNCALNFKIPVVIMLF